MNNPERLVDDFEEAIPPRLRDKINEFFHPLSETRLQISIPFRVIGKIDDPWSAL